MLLYEPYELVPFALVELEILPVVEVGFGEAIGVELGTTLEDRALGIKADDWVLLELMRAIDVGTETDIETDMSNDKGTEAVGVIVVSLALVVTDVSAVKVVGTGDGVGISVNGEADGTATGGVSTGTETVVEGSLEASDTDVGRAVAVSGGASTTVATVAGAAV